MREFKENIRTIGKLYLNNKLFQENVELEFEDNYYTNSDKTGKIKVNDLSADFINNLKPNKYKFRFVNSDNKSYYGKITGWQNKGEIYSNLDYLFFSLDNYQQHWRFAEFRVNSFFIKYKIPFAYLLGRNIVSSYGFDDNYIIKFRKPIFTITVNSVVIKFDEHVYFPPHKKPDDLCCRDILPTIHVPFKSRKRFIPTLNSYEKLMDDVMLIISFIFYHKIDWYGYRADLWDKNDKMHEFLEFKDYNKSIGDDYLFEDNFGKFEKHFTGDVLSELISKYRNYSLSKKDKIKNFINELLLIKKNLIYKSRFISSLFLLEAVCEHFVKEHKIAYSFKEKSKYQEKIKAVIKYLRIPLQEINFIYSNTKTKSGNKLWIITDYRNQIAHSDIKSNFSLKKSVREYIKVMELIRRLIFILIEPKFQKIPYPENNF